MHFGPLPGKPQHSIFLKKFQSEDAEAHLLADAAAHPSHAPEVTRLTIEGVPLGEPGIVLQRWFGHPIGYSSEERYRQDTPDAPYVRMVMNYRGDLVTAFPALLPLYG